MTPESAAEEFSYEPPESRGPRRRRRNLTIVGVLVALLAVGAVLLSILDAQSRRESVDISTALPTATSTMATPIQDGHIEFLVESITPLDLSPEPPSLWFQVVKVRVTNTGTTAQVVSPEDQWLVDDKGHEYHPDPLMLAQLNKAGGSAVLLQPDETTTISIPFDYPPTGAKPVMVVLHATPLTPGVAVTLT